MYRTSGNTAARARQGSRPAVGPGRAFRQPLQQQGYRDSPRMSFPRRVIVIWRGCAFAVQCGGVVISLIGGVTCPALTGARGKAAKAGGVRASIAVPRRA